MATEHRQPHDQDPDRGPAPDRDHDHDHDHAAEHGHDPSRQEHEDSSTPTTMVHLIQRSLPVVILAAVVAGLWFYMHSMNGAPSVEHGPGAGHQGPPPKVQVMTVRGQDVPYVPRFLGQTEAYQRVEIRARIDGFLQKRAFAQGSKVEKGQLLFQIDPSSYKADLEIARAKMNTSRATLHRARKQVQRYQKLVKQDAATPSELEDWQTKAQVAAANVQEGEAQVDKARLNLSYTSVQAPMTGEIGEAIMDVGSYVAPGANSLLAVEKQTDPIYVRYSVSERDLQHWREMRNHGTLSFPPRHRAKVAVILPDGQAYDHTGNIDFMDVSIDPSTGTGVVRAKVPNPQGQLRPGQYVHVKLLGITRLHAVLVPQPAVMQNPTGSSVFVLGKEGKVEQRPVQLGRWHGQKWVITGGLKPGDRVITNNLSILHPGMPVRVARGGEGEAQNGGGGGQGRGSGKRQGSGEGPGPGEAQGKGAGGGGARGGAGKGGGNKPKGQAASGAEAGGGGPASGDHRPGAKEPGGSENGAGGGGS